MCSAYSYLENEYQHFMFLTTNNEVIVSLKSPWPPVMVFHRKRAVWASASRLLLPLVSSVLGNKTTISCLSVQQSKLLHPRCCERHVALLPSASCNSAIVSSTAPLGDSFDCCPVF